MSKSFSLEEKIKELEKIEEFFQKPNMDLEQAIAKHKEALTLSKEILAYLEKAETTLTEIDLSTPSEDQV